MRFAVWMAVCTIAFPLAQARAADDELDTVETSVAAPPAESLYKSEESGAYFGLEAKTTTFSDRAGNYGAVMLGMRGAWRLNEGLAVGAAVYHVMNDLNYPMADFENPTSFQANRLGLTYGGIFAEYSYESWRLFHPAASLLLGGGSASLNPRDATEGGAATSQFFYVLEPQLSGIVNLSPAVHAGINLSYRIARSVTNDLDDALSSGSLSGLSGGLFVQAGWF